MGRAPQIQAVVNAADLAALHALDTITDPASFDAAYDSLERAIAAAVMGTAGNVHLRARVLALSARLTAAAARSEDVVAGVRVLQSALEARDLATAEGAAAAIASAWLEQNGGTMHAKVGCVSW